MKTNYKLNNEQLEFYKNKGYLVCNDVFSSEEIKNIVQWSREIENLPEEKGKWMKYYDQSLKTANYERQGCHTDLILSSTPTN